MKYFVGYTQHRGRKIDTFKVTSHHESKDEANAVASACNAKYGSYRTVISDEDLAQIRAREEEEINEKRKEGIRKSIEKRKASGKKVEFVLCPRCNAKSKKLMSEMGGLQTRVCQNGHRFGYDTFAGMGRYTTPSPYCP